MLEEESQSGLTHALLSQNCKQFLLQPLKKSMPSLSSATSNPSRSCPLSPISSRHRSPTCPLSFTKVRLFRGPAMHLTRRLQVWKLPLITVVTLPNPTSIKLHSSLSSGIGHPAACCRSFRWQIFFPDER